MIPHNHNLDGRFHRECPSCSYTQLRLREITSDKKANEEVRDAHKKNVERYAKARARKRQ